jgi:hypothetical protein
MKFIDIDVSLTHSVETCVLISATKIYQVELLWNKLSPCRITEYAFVYIRPHVYVYIRPNIMRKLVKSVKMKNISVYSEHSFFHIPVFLKFNFVYELLF